MDKKTRLNMISSLGLQFITILSGFIIPRQILLVFGSDINGLVNSLTQFLNYISLIEGGLGSVLMTAFYKPLNQNCISSVSSIIITGNRVFQKIAKIFLIYLLLVSFIYPLGIKTKFPYEFVCSLSLILGITLFVQYYFSITWKILLQADRKVYISASVQMVVIILNTILTILAIRIYPSIHFVKLVASASFILQPLLYNRYINQKYNIDRSAPQNVNALSNRWDGFGINLAAFLNNNTDVIILTLFSSLSNVSIYSVYSLVVIGIKSLITAISAGISPSLGKEYSLGNIRKLNEVFDKYENLIFFSTFSIYACTLVLIIPFVMNYTSGIQDADYRQPVFSVLLILSYAIFCLREPYVNMAYVGNAYRDISKYAYIEAGINVFLSLIFVSLMGLNGAALGTLISMTYRTLFHIFYLRKNILKREPKIFFVKFCFYFISSSIGIYCANNLVYHTGENGWTNWIIKAVFTSIIIFSFNILSAFLLKIVGKKNAIW